MAWDMGACMLANRQNGMGYGACMLTDSGITGTEWYGIWAPAC